jgi:hypothetical protein
VSPTRAPWLRDLPVEDRGFVVPAEAGWKDGVPVLALNRPEVNFCLSASKRCVVCGLRIRDSELTWRAFSSEDVERADREIAQADVVTERMYGGHLSCMIYAVKVCPYWARSNARLGKESQWEPGAPRGGSPALLGASRVDFAFDFENQGDFNGWMCLYVGPFARLPFTDDAWANAIRAEHGRSLDGRVHFAPGFGGEKRLARMYERAWEALPGADRLPDVHLTAGANSRRMVRVKTPWL